MAQDRCTTCLQALQQSGLRLKRSRPREFELRSVSVVALAVGASESYSVAGSLTTAANVAQERLPSRLFGQSCADNRAGERASAQDESLCTQPDARDRESGW